MKKKKTVIALLIFVTIIIVIVVSPLFYAIRSYLIMLPYSYTHKRDSILHEKGVDFNIPSGMSTRKKDWYPLMLYFNSDEGFSRYTGENLSLTILYSFGAFNYKEGYSTYYNPDSDYYSSFYGGYVVYNHDNPTKPFGYTDDMKIAIKELSLIPKYDQTKLVLPSIGCPYNDIFFEVTIDSVQYDISYIGAKDWIKVDSTILTNGPIHVPESNSIGYIQYGRPSSKLEVDTSFPLVSLKGRMYVRYSDKYNMTFILYILAPSLNIVDECDRNILSNTNIR